MIVEDPHEALYTVSRPVTEEEFKDVVRLASKALAHLKKTKNGVGLAANQVGDLRRWFVAQRFKIVINPEILEVSDETETLEEGCLSKPGFKCMRKRALQIKVRWTSHKGKIMHRTLEGMAARIFQHEYDHLNGINIFSPQRPGGYTTRVNYSIPKTSEQEACNLDGVGRSVAEAAKDALFDYNTARAYAGQPALEGFPTGTTQVVVEDDRNQD